MPQPETADLHTAVSAGVAAALEAAGKLCW